MQKQKNIKIHKVTLAKLENRLLHSRNHFSLLYLLINQFKNILKGSELKKVLEIIELEAVVIWVCSIARYPQTVNRFLKAKK